ncbi:MAG: tRNA (N(6)-L-threonylcarbamoyladenosine(37)-C(2))-methylthiotransferase MtaB [Alphaproteobacteria bacterium]|nr:tRNA (N(6)-L-threonylcarbamoyladenosine(37)-C(2))-methylthiotransferase MtaB [Alphaproteobacteria bacterium]
MADPEIITFGCRLNTYESEVMREHMRETGLSNAIIVNTCAVTAEAERQARQAIRRARRNHPDARIIVTGCAAQISPDAYAAMPEVDRVLGNNEKLQRGSFEPGDSEPVRVNDIMTARETANHLIEGFDGRARAFIQVQNGCDHRCTFCIIPFGRGNSRSVPIGEISRQVRTLVERGFHEVVLSGVDIASYGPDLPGHPTLGQMVRRVLTSVPELARLRLSSLDPAEVDDDLMRLIAEEPRLMPHLHLSLQAGDDLILKRMKRRHSRQQAIDLAATIRQRRPDVVFGADFIAGFPTETEAMFANTLAMVEECGLTYLHVFRYSPRPDTPAARMPQVPQQEVKVRAARLRAAGQAALSNYLDNEIGGLRSALIERDGFGRTEYFTPVEVAGAQPGPPLEVRITSRAGDKLVGAIAQRSAA